MLDEQTIEPGIYWLMDVEIFGDADARICEIGRIAGGRLAAMVVGTSTEIRLHRYPNAWLAGPITPDGLTFEKIYRR